MFSCLINEVSSARSPWVFCPSALYLLLLSRPHSHADVLLSLPRSAPLAEREPEEAVSTLCTGSSLHLISLLHLFASCLSYCWTTCCYVLAGSRLWWNEGRSLQSLSSLSIPQWPSQFALTPRLHGCSWGPALLTRLVVASAELIFRLSSGLAASRVCISHSLEHVPDYLLFIPRPGEIKSHLHQQNTLQHFSVLIILVLLIRLTLCRLLFQTWCISTSQTVNCMEYWILNAYYKK